MLRKNTFVVSMALSLILSGPAISGTAYSEENPSISEFDGRYEHTLRLIFGQIDKLKDKKGNSIKIEKFFISIDENAEYTYVHIVRKERPDLDIDDYPGYTIAVSKKDQKIVGTIPILN
jgi:hypothetical protein